MGNNRLRLAVLLGTVLLLLGIAGGTGFLVMRMRATLRAQATVMVERIGHAAEVTVNRQLLQVDGTLAALPALLELTLAPATATDLLRHLNASNFAFGDLIIAYPDGRPWAAALPGFAGRPLPAAVPAAARGGALAVAGPVPNPGTGEWCLYLVRQVRIAGLGPMLAVAEVPVPLLGAALAPLANHAGLAVTLERAHGPVLAQVPHAEALMGRVLERPGPPVPLTGVASLLPGQRSSAATIHAMRETLYRDLVVGVRLPLADAEREWERDRERLLAMAAAAALLLLALGVALSSWLDQREQMEAERAAARSLLLSAVESMTDGFVMFDAEDRLVLCNQRYREIYAATGQAIRPGATFEEIVRAGVARGQYPQAKGQEEAFVADHIAWHRSNQPPRERLLPDGRWILVTERLTPTGGVVGIRTDVTALKAANAALASARDSAAAAAVAKSRFLARMSHELRTPLNGVLGIAQALARDPALTAEHRRQAATLEAAGRHLVAVANDVLDLARAEAGQLTLRQEPVALVPLLQECLTLAGPAAEAKRHRLHLEHDEAVPAGVLADGTRLRQLLLNLLSNAVKFTPEGGAITLRTGRDGAADAEGRIPLRLEVRDTGPGVPAAACDAVFDDFVRLPGDHQQEGAGLGLAIARQVAEGMGGRLTCEPNAEAATGAVFVLRVPLAPAPIAAATDGAKPATARPQRLLIADDVPANLAVARALLANLGHEVVSAGNGEEAVRAVAEAAAAGRPFDAVLMDMMMPVLDGVGATHRIRALPGAAGRIPVVAVSASVFPEDIAACRAAGMDGHLSKPIERDALLALLGQLERGGPLEEAWPEDAAATPAGPPLLERRGGRLALAIPGLDPAMARDLLPGLVEEIAFGLDRLAAAPEGLLAAEARQLGASAAMLGARRLEHAAARLAETPGQVALEHAMRAGRATLAALRVELGETV